MAKAEFRTVNEQEGGQWVRYRVVSCRCGAEGRVRDTSPRLLPASPLIAAFRRIGWTNVRPDRGVCPACSAPKPKPALEKPAMIAVEAPRQPTPDDKRRIREELFATYNEDKGCYSKSHSDRSVASGLNVPFAWVSQMRDALGFGPDQNEAKSAFDAEVGAIRQQLKAFQEEVLAAVANRSDEMEKRLNAIERAGLKGAA